MSDLRKLLIASLNGIAERERAKRTEEGYVLAFNDQVGDTSYLRYLCPGNDYDSIVVSNGIRPALLFDTEQKAETYAREEHPDIEFRIVHIRRHPAPPTEILDHRAVGVLERMAEV